MSEFFCLSIHRTYGNNPTIVKFTVVGVFEYYNCTDCCLLFLWVKCDHVEQIKLRCLEVALMEYRESLEDWRVKNLEEIARKVAVHRKRLQSEYGFLSSNDDVSASSMSQISDLMSLS